MDPPIPIPMYFFQLNLVFRIEDFTIPRMIENIDQKTCVNFYS